MAWYSNNPVSLNVIYIALHGVISPYHPIGIDKPYLTFETIHYIFLDVILDLLTLMNNYSKL